MPALLALLSLLGGCSSMLDVPDEPRLTMDSTAPLAAQPGHRRRKAGSWHTPSAQPPRRVSAPSLAVRDADAGAPDPARDAGVEPRSNAP